jgi:hypothetical protein
MAPRKYCEYSEFGDSYRQKTAFFTVPDAPLYYGRRRDRNGEREPTGSCSYPQMSPNISDRSEMSRHGASSLYTASLGLIDHYGIVRGALYKGFSAASELGDGNSMALLAGRLHENFRDCGRLTGELQRGPLLNIQNNVLVNPDYTRAIARIVSAVAPYPEAREAVIAALRDLDEASALVDRSGGALVDG